MCFIGQKLSSSTYYSGSTDLAFLIPVCTLEPAFRSVSTTPMWQQARSICDYQFVFNMGQNIVTGQLLLVKQLINTATVSFWSVWMIQFLLFGIQTHSLLVHNVCSFGRSQLLTQNLLTCQLQCCYFTKQLYVFFKYNHLHHRACCFAYQRVEKQTQTL